jgi:hypothetical protein
MISQVFRFSDSINPKGVYDEKQNKGILGTKGTLLPHERLELSAGISGSFPEYDRET